MSQKPREYFIVFTGDPQRDMYPAYRKVTSKSERLLLPPGDEEIHVIEASALEAERKWADTYQKKYEFAQTELATERAEHEKTKKLLLEIENLGPSEDPLHALWRRKYYDKIDELNAAEAEIARLAKERDDMRELHKNSVLAIKERDALRAHADRMAEALSKMACTSFVLDYRDRNKNHHDVCPKCIALSDYKKFRS